MLEKFDEMYDDGRIRTDSSILIAKGQYESKTENVLKGFNIFQKKYVYRNVIIELILVVIAIITQVTSIITNQSGDVSFNVLLIVICVVLGIWLIIRPINTKKNLAKSIEKLSGSIYEAEIYTDMIKISTIYDAVVENNQVVDTETLANTEKTGAEAIEEAQTAQENKSTLDIDAETEDEIPATLIHLDNGAVEIVECDDIFVIYIQKTNLFVIPKSAFKPYELENIKTKLSEIMGVRYKG